jgi:transglutaminase-like putative cysteine protease
MRAEELLATTEFLDHGNLVVRRFVDRVLGKKPGTQVANAIALYHAVRDNIMYEVYGADLSREGLRASSIIGRGRGFCIHKSTVYAAVCRAAGIPSSAGRRYVEFLHEYGECDDFPYETVIDGIREAHPHLFAGRYQTTSGSLIDDAGITRQQAA